MRSFVRNMTPILRSICSAVALIATLVASAQAQQTSVVPNVVNFAGTLRGSDGKPLTGSVGVTFSLYKEQEGGSPLWIETQTAQPDRNGQYSVMLGSRTGHGLPTDVFASGEARWLSVQVQGEPEQTRVMLMAVPYALKAGDAQTIGGLPASAFMLASPDRTSPATTKENANSASDPTVGGSGTTGYLAAWSDNNGDLGNSIVFQKGTGSSAKIGINESSPLFTLDVNGTGLMRGLFEMATTGFASATTAYNSNPLNLESSAFNSGTGKYTLNHFQWQAEATGNNTTSPSATLNLLFNTDPNSPAQTGLKISSKGLFTFAPGQTFPGTGTITGITTASGSGLMGGGSSGSLNLSLTDLCSSNQVLQWNGTKWVCSSAGSGTISGVTAGTDLKGGGTSGDVTLSVDTTKVPQLAVSNTFTGSQTINANGGTSALSVTQQATSGQTYGILGTTDSSGNRSAGILGQNLASSGIGFGVEGYLADDDGAGVFGANGNPLSQTGGSLSGTFGSGLWGDGSSAGLGMIATADLSNGIAGYNTSTLGFGAIVGENFDTTSLAPGVIGYSNAPVGLGILGAGTTYSNNFLSNSGSNPVGVVGDSSATGGIGVWGTTDNGTSVFGSTGSGTGVFGLSANAIGVYGESDGNAADIAGVYGFSAAIAGVIGASTTGDGVYGSTGGDAGAAGDFYNSVAGVFDYALFAGGPAGQCAIDSTGKLSCTNTPTSSTPLPDGRRVELYSMQSPENWFEDFGSGTLKNGVASVGIEPTFLETVNSNADYHVFLTPRGDCKGLYVDEINATGFTVREMGSGRSNIAFDYRIVAKRKGSEQLRLVDVTVREEKLLALRQRHQQPTLARPVAIIKHGTNARPQVQSAMIAPKVRPARPISDRPSAIPNHR